MQYYSKLSKKHYFNPLRAFVVVFLLSIIILVSAEGYRLYITNKNDESQQSDDVPVIVGQENSNQNSNQNTNTNSQVVIPEKGQLVVPFTVQAPNANWDAAHEETCEEASLMMVKNYIQKTSFGSPESTDNDLLALVAFEEENGYKVDVTVKELSEIAKKYYGMKSGRVVKNFTITDIKREIALGHPVIIPAAGKLLANPNFRDGGPKYHMLVIKGYDKDGFITNDPGTRKGEGFRYTFDTLFNAIHDWNESDILQGQKAFLVFD